MSCQVPIDQVSMLRILFEEYDTDKDGYVTKAEARDVIKNSGMPPGDIDEDLKELDAEFDKYDTNKDGKILWEEVIAAIDQP